MSRILLALLAIFIPFAAQADGIAKPWQLGFQDPASPVMEQLEWLHDHFLLYIITAITIIVLILMIYIVFRFNRKANPVASKTTHNVKLEIIWTLVPVLILIAIAVPSVRIHNYMETPPENAITLKVTGYQWYWGYEYPDNGGIAFESRIVEDKDLKEADIRLLSVDNVVVVPVNTPIRVQTTGADVIHAWAVPAFGVKRDAVPGRLNETWFEANKEGRYYGQCSELCGIKHGFMPIVVDVVSKEKFDEWVVAHNPKAAEVPAPVVKAVAKPVVKRPVDASAEEPSSPDEATPTNQAE